VANALDKHASRACHAGEVEPLECRHHIVFGQAGPNELPKGRLSVKLVDEDAGERPLDERADSPVTSGTDDGSERKTSRRKAVAGNLRASADAA